MKTTLVPMLFALMASTSALADGVTIPDYPQYDCSGPACVSVARGQDFERINVIYRGYLDNDPSVSMGAILNGQAITASREFDRDGAHFALELPLDLEGDLAVYFSDSTGKYDSALGSNYHFSLKR